MALLRRKVESGKNTKNSFRTEVKAPECAYDRMKEAFEKVEKDEALKLSTVQESMIRSTGYLLRIIAPAGGQGCVTMSHLCLHVNSFPMEDYVLWVSGGEGAYKLVTRDLWRGT